MILRTGVDLIEIERIQTAIRRHGQRYLNRVYTPAEIDACAGRPESLAARFAAKEAVSKALGCGIGEVAWQEIEILSDDQHTPSLHLHGAAAQKAQQLGLTHWSLSLSHSQSHAIAFVVALG
jgi:holo-[acyl-carrier protein] synthase